jgi:hypothetical protein
MRKAKLFKDYHQREGEEVGIVMWHAWGREASEDGETPVAIVEHENGRVSYPMADRLQFIIPWQQED